jgi:hypothetical protein
MMKYKLPNGQFIGASQAFTYNEIQYPSNWISLSTAEGRAALGIIEIPEQQRPNDQYYWVVENDDGSFTTTPKDLEDGDEYTDLRGVTRRKQGLKSLSIDKVKMTAGTLLAQTDWMVIRKAERDVAIPADVVAKRAAIVAESERLEAAITAVTSVKALVGVMNGQQWGDK